jgi:hypothetical protein
MVDQHVEAPATAVDKPVLGSATPRASEVPPAAAPPNEGRTLAAWTTVAIIIIGGIVAGLGVAFGQPWLAWTGGGIIIVGLIVGAIMRARGHGQPKG